MEGLLVARAATGSLFSLLVAVALSLAPGPSSAGGVDVVGYYSHHESASLWQAVLAGLAIVCLLLFAGVVADLFPEGPGVLAPAAVTATLYLVAMGAWESVAET